MDKPKKGIAPVIRERRVRPVSELPASEAEVLAKSAEAIGRKTAGKGGRPKTRPACGKATFLLPLTLIEKLDAAAKEKSGGNKSALVEKLLEQALAEM